MSPQAVPQSEVTASPAQSEHNARRTAQNSRARRFVEAGLGLTMIGVAALGIGGVVNHELNLDRTVSVGNDNASPSDALSQEFEAFISLAAGVGALVVAKRGVHNVMVSFSPEKQALHDMAHADRKQQKNGFLRAAAGASAIVVGAGVLLGNYVDTARDVSSAQSNVADYFNDILGAPAKPGEGNFVITNSPAPELANSNNVSVESAGAFITQAEANNITAIPVAWEWHSAQRQGQPDAKIQVLTASMPESVTQLPPAAEDCSDISVAAAKELGVAKGETFTIDGVEVTVKEILDSQSGLNLLPVLFNNADYARCMKNNPNQPFTAVLAQGDQQQITDLLREQGMTPDNIADRAFVIPTEAFVENTKKTGQNNVDPLVLQSMIAALFITGAALGNRSRSRLANNRPVNTVHEANGMSKRMINGIMVETAESEAFKSALLATPLVLAVDVLASGGIPGAEIGPSLKTVLVVIGGSWAANRAGTALAMRRERRVTDLAKGQE